MKSGEFAKLCNTTKNTLIHYDELGLLHPSSVGGNGYRDYSYADRARFIAITTFADAGFSLRQIQRLLADGDSAELAEVAQDNEIALQSKIEELERSAVLLKEIVRQAKAAEAPVDVQIDLYQERQLLTMEAFGVLHPGDADDGMWADSTQAIKALGLISPESMLAPYGFEAEFDGEEPTYTRAYFLLPERIRIPSRAARFIEDADDLAFETMPLGEYATVGFDGSWPEVAKAYQKLASFLRERGETPKGAFYETSLLRLLDTYENDRYRCSISVRVRTEEA